MTLGLLCILAVAIVCGVARPPQSEKKASRLIFNLYESQSIFGVIGQKNYQLGVVSGCVQWVKKSYGTIDHFF